MNSLGQYIKECVARNEFDNQVQKLIEMPDWEFCVVMGEGFFEGICAGTTHKGVYYGEVSLMAAYFKKWPDADPLI